MSANPLNNPVRKETDARPDGVRKPEVSHDKPDEMEVQKLAYEFWLERGSPHGSPEEDWFRAKEELSHLRRRARSVGAA
jgi:hypothetical protein